MMSRFGPGRRKGTHSRGSCRKLSQCLFTLEIFHHHHHQKSVALKAIVGYGGAGMNGRKRLEGFFLGRRLIPSILWESKLCPIHKEGTHFTESLWKFQEFSNWFIFALGMIFRFVSLYIQELFLKVCSTWFSFPLCQIIMVSLFGTMRYLTVNLKPKNKSKIILVRCYSS